MNSQSSTNPARTKPICTSRTRQTLRILTGVLLALLTVATTTVRAPAAAATDGLATIRATQNGDLIIDVHAAYLSMYVRGNALNEFSVIIDDADGNTLLIETYPGITRHVRITSAEGTEIHLGRSDQLTRIGGSLHITEASRSDEDLIRLDAIHLEVAGNATITGRIDMRADRVAIAGDLDIRSTGPSAYHNVQDSEVLGRIHGRTTDAESRLAVWLIDTSAGSLNLRGGPLADIFVFDRTPLGPEPRLSTLDGDDVIRLRSASWTGVLKASTAKGDDLVSLRGPLNELKLRTNSGDDYVLTDATFTPLTGGPVLIAGSGYDTLSMGPDAGRTPFSGFEEAVTTNAA